MCQVLGVFRHRAIWYHNFNYQLHQDIFVWINLITKKSLREKKRKRRIIKLHKEIKTEVIRPKGGKNLIFPIIYGILMVNIFIRQWFRKSFISVHGNVNMFVVYFQCLEELLIMIVKVLIWLDMFMRQISLERNM